MISTCLLQPYLILNKTKNPADFHNSKKAQTRKCFAFLIEKTKQRND